MDILDRVKQLQNIFEDDPSSMAQEPRPMFADGQLVSNTVDGSRPGYGGPGSGAKPGVVKSEATIKAISEAKQKKGFARYNTAYDKYDGQRKDTKKYTFKEWKNLTRSQRNNAFNKVDMKLEPGAYKGEFSKMTDEQKANRRETNRTRYAQNPETRETAIKKAQDYYYEKGGSKAQYKKDMKKTKGKATLAKEKNRLLKYMEIAFNKGNVKFEQILDKSGTFVGIKDKSHKIDGKFKTYVPFEQYEKKYKNNKNYLPITEHRDYKNFDTFFKSAKKFKTEAPDTILSTYFQKYERVPTYSEMYNFFQRDPRFKGYRQNALEIHHRALMENKPTRNLQLTLFDKNNKATSILDAYKNSKRPEYKNLKLVDQQLKDLGIRVKVGGRMLGISEELPGQTLEIAKKETVNLFKQKVKENPKLVEEMTQKLGILGCPKGLPAASGGRIKFDKGGACVLKGKRVLAQGLKTGFKEGSEAILATAILKGGKSLKDIAKLKNLVGPAALAFLAAEEAGYVGYDILSKGKSFKEAIGDSYFNSFLGTKTKYDKDGKPYQVKVDPIKERNKRMIEEGMTKEQMGKIAAYEGALKEEDRILNVFDKLDTAEQGQLDEMSESSDFSYLPNRTKEFKKQEDKARADLRDIGKTGAIDKVLSVDAQGGVDALTEGLRRNELAQLQSVDNIFQSRKGDKNRAARKRELMLQNPDILNYMGPYPTTLGFARGGLSGGDTSGPPPESGPMSQGLRSLYKNGRKL